MEIGWDEAKNEKLKAERGLSFEEIAAEILAGRILDIKENPSHPNQQLFILWIRNSYIVVPFVQKPGGVFLKTAYNSRKARKTYGGGSEHE
jgi:uncharacterized DUF497 family protein